MVKINGRKIRNTESPADFRAVNSLRSANEPKAMMDATKMAKGNAKLTNRADAYIMSSAITHGAKPLPIRSSAYTHKNCMSRMNRATGMVTANGAKKDRNKRLANRLTFQR